MRETEELKEKLRELMDRPFKDMGLSKIQEEAVNLACRGATYEDMAKMLDISPQAVTYRLKGAKDILGVSSTNDLVKKFYTMLRLALEA